MTINSSFENGKVLLVPHGSIDSSTADKLDEVASALDFDAIETVTIDFSDVDYISSKCLRILISMSRKLKEGKIVILGANPTVSDVFHLSGLSSLLNIK